MTISSHLMFLSPSYTSELDSLFLVLIKFICSLTCSQMWYTIINKDPTLADTYNNLKW